MITGMWRNIINNDETMINVVPIQDDYEHHEGPDCVCGPDVEGIGGGAMLLVKHHSLDGRELTETDDEEEVGDTITATFTTTLDGHWMFDTWFNRDMTNPAQIGMLMALVDHIERRIEALRAVEQE